MRYPNFNEEKKLWKKGYKRVAGFDEAGRGPLAGPVMAAVVSIKRNSVFKLPKVNDSKKITAQKREELYSILINHPSVEWSVGMVSEKVIDKINIFEATKLAAEKALKKLKRRPDFLILDGNFIINFPVSQKPIVKADGRVFCCAAASIIAKVTRDRMMIRYHNKYPKYGFDKHKGYPTKLHIAKIKKYGPCKIHRMSFNLH